jgi:hypothetical protein
LKTDKSIKDLWKRANNFSNIDDINDRLAKKKIKHDEYYLSVDSIPPRFLYYRDVRVREWEKLGHKLWSSDDYDLRITQDELNYSLRAKLLVPPEQRYQDNKANWSFHELSYFHQKTDDNGKCVDILKDYGCGYNGGGCVPECRYYPEKGRIEDAEVIRVHKAAEEFLRKSNLIIKEPNVTEEELEEFLQQRFG